MMFKWIPNYISDLPLHGQLKRKIISNINRGEFKRGDFLPSVRTVCFHGSVSKEIVEKAYRELTDQGILLHIKGKGYFIRKDKLGE